MQINEYKIGEGMKINVTKKFLLASSVAMAMSQVSAAPTARIIGGSQATAGSYPWIVSLKGSGGDHFCGGSLIDKEWVMTAAHCVEDETASGMSVVVGEFNIVKTDTGEQKRNVSRIILHPQYNQGAESNNDIALLKLASPVSNAAVTPIIPSIMKDIKAGSALTVMGWGNQSTTGEEFPNRLFQVEVPLVTNQQCSDNYAVESTTITENMLCAGLKQGGKDSCQGDSGGPLLYQLNGTWQQVGVVSFGVGCALPDFPGVYARVEKYNDWVNQQVGSTSNPNPTEPVTPVVTAPEPTTPEPTPDVPVTPNTGPIDLTSLNLPEEIELVAMENRPEKSILIMKNNTSQSIKIINVSVNQSAFNIDQNNCVKVLKAGASCKMTLSYQPEVNGDDAEADLIIDLDDGSNLSVALFGTNLESVGGTENDSNDDDANSDDIYGDDFADSSNVNDIEWYLDSDVWIEEDDGFSMNGSELELNDFATMSAEIEGEGEFEFDFDFENDSDENYCSYYVDGKLVRTVRGSNRSTTHHVTKLSKGKHEIMWVYKKKSENSGSLKIKNIKLSKTVAAPSTTTATNETAPTNVEPASSTPTNSLSSTAGETRSGGGSTDILLLSGLLMLLARSRKMFTSSK